MSATQSERPKSSNRSWLVATCIVGLLVVAWYIVHVNTFGYAVNTREGGTRARIAMIANALAEYHLEYGAYPDELAGLANAKIAESASLVDKWRRPFIYRRIGRQPGDSFTLFSRGSDGLAGSPDDVRWPIGETSPN